MGQVDTSIPEDWIETLPGLNQFGLSLCPIASQICASTGVETCKSNSILTFGTTNGPKKAANKICHWQVMWIPLPALC